MTTPSSSTVLILGGGLAGLSAALELADHDLEVMVLEEAPTAGGKARSWQSAEGGRLGNFDHLVPGWHVNVRALLERLNRTDRLDTHAGSAVFSQGRRLSRLSPLPLPGAFSGLAQRFSYYSEYSLQEKASSFAVATLLAAARDLRLEQLDEISLRAWGVGFNASIRPFLRHMLDPYTLHALTTPGHSISARTAAAVMRWRLSVPTPFASSLRGSLQVDLVDRLVELLEQKGVILRTNTPVTRLFTGRTRVEAVEAGGERLEGAHIISALPPERLSTILPPELLRYHYFRDLAKLRSIPIASIQLFFRTRMVEVKEPLLYSDSELGLYCRDITSSLPPGEATGTVLSCVLTRYESFTRLSDLELLNLVLRELRVMFPQLRSEWLERSAIQRNDDTPSFLHTTGSWPLRPRVRSPLANLMLAGDWIRHPVDLACLEGAVLSGKLAAHAVLEDLGRTPTPPLEVKDRAFLRTLGATADLAEMPRHLVRRVFARIDRRRHGRVEHALDAYLEDMESHVGWTSVLLLNLSYNGVFFVSEASPRVGARVRIRVRTYRGEQIELRGRVVRVEEVRDRETGSIGVGCKVRPLNNESDRLWEQYTRPD